MITNHATCYINYEPNKKGDFNFQNCVMCYDDRLGENKSKIQRILVLWDESKFLFAKNHTKRKKNKKRRTTRKDF